MVIANNKINTLFFCKADQFNRFYSTIEGDDQGKAIFNGIINPGFAYTIAFPVAMGYIEIKFVIKLFEEAVHGSYCSGAINIVITKDKYLFFFGKGKKDAVYSLVHILHQPGIM